MRTVRNIFVVVVFCVLCGAGPLHAQSMGFEEDEWSRDAEESRYSGITRKSGTLLRGVDGDSPAEQLVYADALLEEGRLRRAGNAYNALVHHWPESAEAPRAQHAFARILLQRGRYDRAFREYQYLIEHYSGLFPYNAVLSEQLEAARGVMEQRRGKFFFFPGFENRQRAIPLFEVLIENAPNWSEIAELRFTIGRIYEKDGDEAEAVAAYENVIVHHGRSPFAREAIFRKALCLEQMARKNPRDEQRARTALQALFAALREDLTDEQAVEIQGLIESLRGSVEAMYYDQAVFYDRNTDSPKSALLAYEDFLRRFPQSDKKDLVMERIAALEAQVGEKE